MDCQEHKEEITLVCVTCDNTLLCHKCLDDHTKEHDIQSPEKVTSQIQQQFNDIFISYSQHLSKIRIDIRDAQELQKEQDVKERQACDKITAQRQLLHKAINESASNLIKFCKQRKQNNMSALQEREKLLSSQNTEITNNQSEITKLLQSENFVEIIKTSKTVKHKKVEDIPLTTLETFDFHTNQINKQSIDTMFGQMTGTPGDNGVSDSLSSLHLQTASENTGSDRAGHVRDEGGLTTISTVNNGTSDYAQVIHPSVPGHAWVKWYGLNEVQLTDRYGNVSETVKFNKQIKGITTTPGDRLLVCGFKDKCLYQVVCGYEPSVYFNSTLHPYDICSTDNGDVFVSMIDSDDYKTTRDSRRMVSRYSSKGLHLSGSAEYDSFGDRLFVIPHRLSVNSTNTAVAVVNITKGISVSSHLVILDRSLNLKLRYDGKVTPANKKYNPNTDVKFYIGDVTFTAECNILVTEQHGESIMLLDSNCQLLKTLWRDDLLPISLCQHYDGELWCGFYKKGGGVIKVIKSSTSGQQMNSTGQINQMPHLAVAGCFVQGHFQSPPNFFARTPMQQMRVSPKWGETVRQQNQNVGGAPVFLPVRTGVPPQVNRVGYKFNTQLRNPPQAVQRNPLMSQKQAVLVQGQEPLTASMLAAAPPQEQKQMLGERLFPLIARRFPDLAGKITGMLLELDNSELLHILECQESLDIRMQEAVAVLKAHQAKESTE